LETEAAFDRTRRYLCAKLVHGYTLEQKRLSISQSRRRRLLGWRIFEVKYLEYILFRSVLLVQRDLSQEKVAVDIQPRIEWAAQRIVMWKQIANWAYSA